MERIHIPISKKRTGFTGLLFFVCLSRYPSPLLWISMHLSVYKGSCCPLMYQTIFYRTLGLLLDYNVAPRVTAHHGLFNNKWTHGLFIDKWTHNGRIHIRRFRIMVLNKQLGTGSCIVNFFSMILWVSF